MLLPLTTDSKPTGSVVDAPGEITPYVLAPSMTVPTGRFIRLLPELTQTLAGVVGVDCQPVSAALPKKFTSQPGAPAGALALTPVTTFRYTPCAVNGMLRLTGPLYTMPASAEPAAALTPAAAI